MECPICNKKINIFSAVKTKNGEKLCKKCFDKLSPLQKERFSFMNLMTAMQCLQREENTFDMSGKFQSTYDFGLLHIDEANHLFVLCDNKQLRPNGVLKQPVKDIYMLKDIEDYNITMKSVNPDYSGPAELELSLIEPHLFLKLNIVDKVNPIIEQDEQSAYIKENPSVLDCRQRLYYSIQAAKISYSNKIYQSANTKIALKETFDNSALDKAKAMFMLEDGYTLEDIKRQRNLLLKAFHPDANNTDQSDYAKRIIDAYKVLSDSIS